MQGLRLHLLADFDEGGFIWVGGRVCKDDIKLHCIQEAAVCAS